MHHTSSCVSLPSVFTFLGALAVVGPLAATPLVIASDDECRIDVDGDDRGTVAAGGVKKVELAPGEHLVSAVCPGGRRWRETVVLGDLQKVVTIPAAGAAPPAASEPVRPAASAPADALGQSGCVPDLEIETFNGPIPYSVAEWVVRAVIHGTACHAASVHPGDEVLAIGGREMRQVQPEEIQGLDEGPVGSQVEWKVKSAKQRARKVVLVRAVVPAAGTVSVFEKAGRVVRTFAYDGEASLLAILQGGQAAAAPTTATGGAGGCTGTAIPCWQRARGTCSSGRGCVEGGTCTGYSSYTCAGKSEFTCPATPGCFWQTWSKTCGGSGQPCYSQMSSFGCNAVPGCAWQATCAGEATPCSALGRELCNLQPGCSPQ